MAQVLLLFCGAVLGAIASAVLERWLRGDIGIRGELAGEWIETVPPGLHKNYERKDLVNVRHRRNARRFHVSIQRTSPDHERGRSWSGAGYISGNDLLILAYPATPGNESSFGVISLHRVHEGTHWFWRGHYLRPATDLGRTQGDSNRVWTPVTWARP